MVIQLQLSTAFLYHFANTLMLPPAMFFTYNFYKFRGSDIPFRKLWISYTLFSLTFIVTSLQFIVPAILPALDRNKEAILHGEVWRLVTPLFIQPFGWTQCLFNGLFFIMFMPIAEYLYGKRVLLIFFGAGILCQPINIYWNPATRGGSSSALYGLMGALFAYILLHRSSFPRPYWLISMAGFTGAFILCFFKDGHAPAFLLGAAIAWAINKHSRHIPGNKEFARKEG